MFLEIAKYNLSTFFEYFFLSLLGKYYVEGLYFGLLNIFITNCRRHI